ncbi:MAG: hypothetical protein Tsb0010_08420 [Parvularculaceae bacterium]
MKLYSPSLVSIECDSRFAGADDHARADEERAVLDALHDWFWSAHGEARITDENCAAACSGRPMALDIVGGQMAWAKYFIASGDDEIIEYLILRKRDGVWRVAETSSVRVDSDPGGARAATVRSLAQTA